MELNIKPLSEEYLDEAIELNRKVFPLDGDTPETAFRVSLDPETYEKMYEKWKTKKLNYFVLLNGENKVIGTTGIYCQKETPEIAWLGWYCIDPNYRNKGFGSKLLEWSINKAKSEGYTKMHLYTSDMPSEEEAQKLYDKFGFKKYDEEIAYGGKYKKIYKERDL